MEQQSAIGVPLAAVLTIFIIPLVGQSQWILQTGNAVDNITDVVMLDSVTAIAIGDRNAILCTTDAGTTWINQTIHLSAIFNWNAISFCDSANGIIVGDNTVWTTSNEGLNWTVRTTPSVSHKCFSVLMDYPASVYVGTDSGFMFHSSDTGNTWISEKISQWSIKSLFLRRGSFIGGYNPYALTPHSVCMRSTMPVHFWLEKELLQFQALGSAGFDAEFSKDSGTGFIVGVQGDLRADPTILRKRISDTMWSKVPTGIMRDGMLVGVSAPSENVVYVCGTAGMLFKSTDGGDTWSDIVVPTTRTLRAIYFFDGKRGVAVGDSGTILYTSSGGVMHSDNNKPAQLPGKFVLFQNYPNPFNPATTIRFDLPVTGSTSLKLFDVLGRGVATLVHDVLQAGEHKVRWDAVNVSSGIYFYRLQSNGSSVTKKLIKLQ